MKASSAAEAQESAGNLGFLPGVQGGVPLLSKSYEGGAGGKKTLD
jgi:hypothetical protein